VIVKAFHRLQAFSILTSAFHSPSAIAELLVLIYIVYSVIRITDWSNEWQKYDKTKTFLKKIMKYLANAKICP